MENTLPKAERLQQTVRPLLGWFDAQARTLPWRSHPTPYRVWISEIMLQQTRVAAVLPYFDRFMEAFPDVFALANAPEDRLLKIWEGLGYYSRARNLQKTAKILAESFGGQLPPDYEALLALPGIGPYTAGAVASIAFGLPVPAVDGNVLRCVSRILCLAEDISRPQTRKHFTRLLSCAIPKDRPGDFNQALMELGALVCLPAAPRCGLCPLSWLCEARLQNKETSLPVKAPKAPKRKEVRTVFLLKREGRVLLRRREETGLLAGMYEPPCLPGTFDSQTARLQIQNWGLLPSDLCALAPARHVFTHVIWEMEGFGAFVTGPLPQGWVAALPEELEEVYALPSAFRAFL